MEGDEHLQVVDHHRARDEALVEQQALDVLGEQVGRAYAERGEALAARLRVRRVLDLIEQPQQRLRLDVEDRPLSALPVTLSWPWKKKWLRCSMRLLPGAIPRAVEHLVEVLRGAVVAGVLRVAEAVGEAVQRARGGDRLVRLPPVHDVEQVRLDPAREDLAVGLEAGEPLRVLEELLDERLDVMSSTLRRRRLG